MTTGTAPAAATAADSASSISVTERSDAVRQFKEAEARRHTGVRGVLRALRLGFSLGSFVLMATLAVVVIVIPRATGSTPLTVLTQSMEPRLPPGTMLIVRPKPISEIKIGDVVTYQITPGQPALISHRVISVSSSTNGQRTFICKGDNNADPDPHPVSSAQIRGVVWYSIPKIGWINQFLNGAARTWIIPLASVGLFIYSAVMLAMGIRAMLRRRKLRAYFAEGEALPTGRGRRRATPPSTPAS